MSKYIDGTDVNTPRGGNASDNTANINLGLSSHQSSKADTSSELRQAIEQIVHERNCKVDEQCTVDAIMAKVAAQKQRWSDDTRAKFPDKINFGGLSSDLAKHTDMWKGGEQFGFNKAVDLCIAALDSVIGEQQA